jgi:cyclic patellamide precursor peptide PatG
MAPIDTSEHAPLSPADMPRATAMQAPGAAGRGIVRAQVESAPCPTCGTVDERNGAAAAYVYALGRVEARFPRPSVEKEFAQVAGQIDTTGKTDRQAFYEVLRRRENRYLARQMCWVFTVQGLETYLLQPRDPADFDLLVEAAGYPDPTTWLSLVIGVRGPIAAPEACNGLMVPIVGVDQIYSFDRASLLRSIPRPDNAPAEFAATAADLFERIIQVTDNAGATDDHRALNYLAVRYPAVYATVADAHGRNASLAGVEVLPSALSGTRRIVEVIFTFTHRTTDVDERFFVRVDVTEEFPFLVTKMSPYYNRLN